MRDTPRYSPRMRVAVAFVVLAVVACNGTASHTATSQGDASAGWKRIEALAVPTVEPAPSADLERAIAIAHAKGDAWRELEFKYPPTPLAKYPQGAEAVEALRAWASAKGGLPPPQNPSELTLGIHDVGALAIESATDPNAQGIQDGLYLGTRMLAEGRNFVEVQVGLTMFSDAKRKLSVLASAGAAKSGGATVDPVPPPLDFVRVLAAEAVQWRRKHDSTTSPDGRKDAAMTQFWLSALDGAQRGEPVATTIARLQKAIDTAAGPTKANVTRFASMLEIAKSTFDELRAPSP